VVTAQNYTQDAVFPGYHWQPSFANDGQRFAHLLPSGSDGTGFWRDEHGLSSWLQIDFNSAKTIDEVDVYTVGDYPGLLTQADPSATATFTQYGAAGFEIDYWTGSAWVAAPGGQITGNNLLWKKITFAALTTSKIKVVVNASTDGVARIAEVEAWGTSVSPRTNIAQAANGGVATAQNYTQDGVFPGYHWQPFFANDGQRFCHLLPSGSDGTGFWRDEHGLDSWLQIDFNGANTIDEVDVFTAGDYPGLLTQADPAPTDTFAQYGAAGLVIKYWNGSAWSEVPGGRITGNNLLWKKVTFAAVTTSKIRVEVNLSSDNVARITEVEAWTPAAPTNARLDPMNRTGAEGEDPLSRNFNWSLPLVTLPGRAGLDLGLSLSYNSLATWLKQGNAVSFDDDRGSPSAGFRLGFPVIQTAFYNTQAQKNAYLLITPSGGRAELRQVGNGNLYQSVDSSYLLLDTSSNPLTLRAPDGSQMSYAWTGNDYVCTKVKDRNGNFISINYDSLWRIDTVIDTLARTVKFNYDANGLSSITQTWTVNGQTQTHNWARFTYTDRTIQTNFSGLTVNGPQNGTTIHALSEVKLADDSRYDFDYTSWGQVWKISQYAADNHLLNYRSYDLPQNNSAVQSDCPRFTVRHDWAENWNRDTNGTAQEVTTNFAIPVDAALPDNSLATVIRTQVTSADGTYQQIYFAGSINGGAGSAPAWEHGLPLLSDTYDSNNAKQRSVITTWTQGDTSAAYQINPRVTETNITDPAGNHARTRVEYAETALSDGTTINLPQNTYEYQPDASTVLRRAHVDYQLTSTYTSRRIIGLVSEQTLYGGPTGSETLMSKISYQYDEGSIQGSDAPIQHDNTNYSASLVAGRGNLTSVTRHDVVNTSQSTTSTVKYNTAGAVVTTLDPLSHGVTISYADSFSDDNNSRNTLAYPTTLTDADGFSSSVKYNYDFGAATWKQTPLPNVTDNEAGPVQTIEYDSLGRIQKVKNLFNNAYTRYEYPASQNRVDTYATIQDGAGEAHSFKITDGQGRVIASAADHPGSAGGYSGQLIYYDTMGRAIKQSNPTETNASSMNPYDWAATGDDSTSGGGFGWVFTQQSYDWKGRPLVTTNTDSTTKTANYGGCGCAGGEVVTLTDEGTLVNSQLQHRQQKIYSDVIGRTAKTEVLNWDGSVYSTTVNTYNARDQVTLIRQFQGNDQSTVYQDTTMSFDGYGRLQTKHLPEQNVGAATVYAYSADDTVYSVTDARNATCTYGYNGRHQVTSATHVLSGQPAIALTYGYDGAGNRTSMTDGLGSKSYSYNQLSQLMSETRTITSVGTFTLGYDYSLGGELKKISDPTNTTINYGFDSVGRLTSVNGSDNLFAGISTYASNFQYRAFDAVKGLTYGNSKTLLVSYDGRLQPASFEVPGILKKSYQRNSDSSLQFTQDQLIANSKFDRSYNYDNLGRISTALSGAEARGQGPTDDRPYHEAFTYDAMDHLTSRDLRHWDRPDSTGTQTYINNRNPSWSYDADGRITSGSTGSYVYDAAGAISSFGDSNPNMTDQQFDGDGQRLKSVQRRYDDQTNQWATDSVTYYLNSTVLGGQVLTELNGQGTKQRTYVYAGQTVLAWQSVVGNGSQSVAWEHRDASGASFRMSDASGQGTGQPAELDPVGADAGLFKPLVWNPPDSTGKLITFRGFEDMDMAGGGCTLDHVPIPCGIFNDLMGAGAIAVRFLGAPKSLVPNSVPITPEALGLVRVWLPDSSQGEEPISGGEYLFAIPQNSSFKFGSVPFSKSQQKILADSNNIINEDDCKKFINDTLAKFKVAKDVDSLDKLLNRARFSYYDTSTFLGGPDYSPSQLGLDTDSTLRVRGAFLAEAAAVTAPNRVNVFLSDAVFDRTDHYWFSHIADTPSYIVHELFHVAGIDKSIVDSQQMTNAIRENCGLVGSDPIILRH
jgi:YD repeat-containing protein